MKNIITLLLLLISFIAFSQEQISFEEEEGYILGNLHQQNDWEVTEDQEGEIISNQIVTDEKASDGIYAFKNGHEDDFDFQFMPIFGAAKMFENPIDFTEGFTLSYDILVTDQMGSDFEFTLFAINEYEEWMPVAGVGIENRGYIYLIKDESYDFDYADAEWEANEWISIKIEVDEENINYYVNEELQKTISNFSQLDIYGFNMLHNNYGYDAYYDNIQFESGVLNAPKYAKEEIKIHPNPAEDFISLQLPSETEIENISIYNIIGQKLISTTSTENIQVSNLTPGAYFIKITDTNTQKITKKMIKK